MEFPCFFAPNNETSADLLENIWWKNDDTANMKIDAGDDS